MLLIGELANWPRNCALSPTHRVLRYSVILSRVKMMPDLGDGTLIHRRQRDYLVHLVTKYKKNKNKNRILDW
jgi:hypothetical protein